MPREKEISLMFPSIFSQPFFIFLSEPMYNLCVLVEKHGITLHKCFWWETHVPRDVDGGSYGEIFYDMDDYIRQITCLVQ